MIRNSRTEEKEGFQELAPYVPSIDLRTDFVMFMGLMKQQQKELRSGKNEVMFYT